MGTKKALVKHVSCSQALAVGDPFLETRDRHAFLLSAPSLQKHPNTKPNIRTDSTNLKRENE